MIKSRQENIIHSGHPRQINASNWSSSPGLEHGIKAVIAGCPAVAEHDMESIHLFCRFTCFATSPKRLKSRDWAVSGVSPPSHQSVVPHPNEKRKNQDRKSTKFTRGKHRIAMAHNAILKRTLIGLGNNKQRRSHATRRCHRALFQQRTRRHRRRNLFRQQHPPAFDLIVTKTDQSLTMQAGNRRRAGNSKPHVGIITPIAGFLKCNASRTG